MFTFILFVTLLVTATLGFFVFMEDTTKIKNKLIKFFKIKR